MTIHRKRYSTGMVKACFILALACCAMPGFAQEQWEKEKEGEIKDVEFEIVKDRQIVLPKASRNFSKVPPRPYEPIKPAITYAFRNFNVETPDYKASVRPLKLQQEALSKMYGNYLSLGFGNYAAVFAEGTITTKRDKNKFMGAHLYAMNFGSGPVNGENSAGSNASLQVFGKSMGKDVTVSGQANYDNRGTYFYGYSAVPETNRDKIRQTWSTYNVNVGIQNTRKGDLTYSLTGGYSYLQDHYKATEGEVSLFFNSEYSANEKGKFLLSADYFLISRNDSLINNSVRHLLRIRPAYQFTPVDKLRLTAGLNMAIQNDQYGGSKTFNLYPNVKAQYELGKNVEAYGILTGDLDKVNLHTLSAENLWINSNLPIYHTNRAVEFRGGISGKVNRKVAFDIGLDVASLKNYYYFINLNSSGTTPVLFNKFNITYDGTTSRVNPYAEISYAQTEAFRLTLRGDYFTYTTETVLEAFHRPAYKFNMNARYNLYDKIILEAGLLGMGGMKAFDPALSVITLDPAVDLNLKARYFISKQISAFLQFNNILSNNYQLYQSYPVRGFQVLGGVSWSF